MKAAIYGCIFLVAFIGMGITFASAEVVLNEKTVNNFTVPVQIIEQLPVDSGFNTSNVSDITTKIQDTTLLTLMDSNYRKTMDPDLNPIGALINKGVWINDPILGESVIIEIYLKPGLHTSSIEQYVNNVRGYWPDENVIVATVPLKNIRAIASLAEVKSINIVYPGIDAAGSAMTQGDSIHRTNELRATYGANGINKKIGVISNGVSNLSQSIATGDLPSDVHVLRNNIGGDEGTAMLEIVHDLSPSATLYFHDKGINQLEFQSAFDNLVSNGTNVICDDVVFLNEPFFEDGTLASHINSVASTNNVVVVSSVGNFAQHHYQGMYYPNGTYHDFSRGGANKDLFVNLPPKTDLDIVLQWNDQWGQSSNDYNLYLYRVDTGRLVWSSTHVQNGAGCNPFEEIPIRNDGNQAVPLKIMIQKTPSASAKVLELFVVPDGIPPLYPASNVVAGDSVIGHSAATNVISVTAVGQSTPNGPIEVYANQGPSTIYFPTQVTRNKPDIVSVDGVTTSGPGGKYNPFWGTSAAAPHIAGIIGDIWSASPSATAQQLRSALTSSAVDLGATGFDYIYGFGRADGMRMFEQFQPPIWVISTLDSTANSGQYSSLKLNNGYPGIASCTPTTGQGLKYNWKDDSGWHMETANSNPGVTDSSLAYNNGNPSIASHQSSSYYDFVNYAYKSGSTWTTEMVNYLGSFEGTGESLAFSGGSPYISYCDRYTGTVYYAYKSGSTWQNDGIKYEQDLDYHSSLAFNNGYPGITYAAVPSGGALMNLQQNNTHMFDPYPYQREEFVRAVNISPSKDVTTLLVPMSLRYAWADGSGWHFETVDTGSNYEGGYSSLAYFNGYPRISYQEANSNLKYAWKDASGWHKEVVDSGTLGPFTSLSIDASGYPKISYSANGYLKYAYKDASGWHTQTVDTAGGSYSSSVVDTSGNHPKISYYAGGHLKYAYK